MDKLPSPRLMNRMSLNNVPSDEMIKRNDSDSSDSSREKDDVEMELEDVVFGPVNGYHGFQDDDMEGEKDDILAGTDDSNLFFLDNGESNAQTGANDAFVFDSEAAWHDSDDEGREISLMANPKLRKLRKYDGEDMVSSKDYLLRLRQQYLSLHPHPSWASDEAVNHDENEGEERETQMRPLDSLLRSSNTNSAKSSLKARLRPEVVSIEKLKDLDPIQPHAITNIDVHQGLNLVASSGLSSNIYLHQLKLRPVPPDPQNPLVTSLQLKNTPLTSTKFCDSANESTRLYLSGRRRYFHSWDLSSGQILKTTRPLTQSRQDGAKKPTCDYVSPSPCGRYVAIMSPSATTSAHHATVNLLSATTHQWIGEIRGLAGSNVRGRGQGIVGFEWWSNGEGMTVCSRGGEVGEYSIIEGAVVMRWQDEGCVNATAIRLSGIPHTDSSCRIGPDHFVAIGSNSGIVNIYDRRQLLNSFKTEYEVSTPKPLCSLSNLVTSVSSLAFSPPVGNDGACILAMASRFKRDALRLVHLPTGIVYRNWPTIKTPLGRVSCTALASTPDGLILLVGNEAGALKAWEVGKP